MDDNTEPDNKCPECPTCNCPDCDCPAPGWSNWMMILVGVVVVVLVIALSYVTYSLWALNREYAASSQQSSSFISDMMEDMAEPEAVEIEMGSLGYM